MLFILVVVTTLLTYVHPADVVRSIGVENVYLMTFLLGIIGGVSALTATGFYATVFAFALGGANPFLLALFSAPGVFIGDLAFWYLGHKAKAVVEHALDGKLKRSSEWLTTKPAWFIPVGTYLYSAFTPLPGDLLMLVLALSGVSLRRVVIPIILGNYTIALIVSLTAIYGISAISNFF